MIDVDRILKTLDWVVPEIQHRFDDSKNNLEQGSQGGYSPRLTEAIDLWNELKGVKTHGVDLEITKEGTVHRQNCLLNCRQFKCCYNHSGMCALKKITFEATGGFASISHLVCSQAKEKSETGKQ